MSAQKIRSKKESEYLAQEQILINFPKKLDEIEEATLKLQEFVGVKATQAE